MIAGIDWSTKALHVCLLPWENDDCLIATVRLTQGDDITRIQSVRPALQQCFATLLPGVRSIPDSIWVEEAWGRFGNTNRKMLPIYGAIVAACPESVACAGISAVEWRKELGLRPNKARDKGEFLRLAQEDNPLFIFHDDNYAEAYFIAKAGRQIMRRHAA